jgi:hypothetical protein
VRSYYLRFFVLVMSAVAVVGFFGGLLLMPSFFLARATAEAGGRYRAALEETVGLRERAGVSARVAMLAERVRILDTFSLSPVTPHITTTVTDALPRGVTLTSLSITRTGTGATLSITGSAATRDALLSLAESLKSVSAFSGVSLPVSSLAADKDIPFSINFAYAATP